MSFPFNTTIPAANNNPSDDQPIMQQNNVSSYGILNVDHVTYGLTNAGTHKFVTFEGTSLNPSLGSAYYQLLPQQFPPLMESGQYIETFIENQPISGSPITGYLPFVKCIGSYVGVAGPYAPGPGTPLTPVSHSLNANIGSVHQSAVGIITVTFAVALTYNTYMIILDAVTALNATAFIKNPNSIVFATTGNWVGKPLQFMVI